MLRTIVFVSLLALGTLSADSAKKHSYLFAWCGDMNRKSSDFIAVIDADPSSPRYGQILRTVPTGVAGSVPHHTEIEMPRSGFLMANGFKAGRTWIFDLRRPLKPRLVSSFGGIDGYMHPHTFYRLPNGNVLATFQYRGGHDPSSEGGGLVEITGRGTEVRAGSAADPSVPEELIRPYSVALLPDVDRAVSTNTAMHQQDGKSRTVQIWQLSTLRMLKTLVLPPGPRGDEQFLPGEPRVLSDGKTVLIHTFNCGLYMMRNVGSDQPSIQSIYSFPGKDCGVPLLTGSWWIQTVPETHSLIVLDISAPEHPREVSKLTLDDSQTVHWISADTSGTRIVVNSGQDTSDHRLFIVNFDRQTGSVSLDQRFRDQGSSVPGVSLDGKHWPHGFQGDAYAHGTVFSR